MSMPTSEYAASAQELITTNRRRRRIRRWIAIGTLPLTLIALLCVGKILSMYAFAHQSISSYVGGDTAGALSAASGQDFLNFFEPYKAPFNAGTARAAADELPEARNDLERALSLASGLEACGVRVNLAIVLERMGDAARADGDAGTASALYGEATTLTLETPDECRSPEADQQSSDPERSLSDALDDLEERLREKQQEAPQEQEQQQPEPEQPQEQPSQESIEQLQERLEQGTEQREQNGESDSGSGDDGGSSSGTEKPW